MSCCVSRLSSVLGSPTGSGVGSTTVIVAVVAKIFAANLCATYTHSGNNSVAIYRSNTIVCAAPSKVAIFIDRRAYDVNLQSLSNVDCGGLWGDSERLNAWIVTSGKE